MAKALLPRYAEAQTISFTDERIKARYVEHDSSGGTSGMMHGYLVKPAGDGPFPAVLVFHENRGLSPYKQIRMGDYRFFFAEFPQVINCLPEGTWLKKSD